MKLCPSSSFSYLSIHLILVVIWKPHKAMPVSFQRERERERLNELAARPSGQVSRHAHLACDLQSLRSQVAARSRWAKIRMAAAAATDELGAHTNKSPLISAEHLTGNLSFVVVGWTIKAHLTASRLKRLSAGFPSNQTWTHPGAGSGSSRQRRGIVEHPTSLFLFAWFCCCFKLVGSLVSSSRLVRF